MNQTFMTSQETRTKTDSVVNDVYELVCSTMGCDGRLILIQRDNLSKTTKDGVTVAKSITYADQASNMIAGMVTEAAIQTDEHCGDGTTTTVFLTKHLYDAFKDCYSFKNKRRLEALIKESIGMISKHVYYPTDVNDEVLYKMALTTSNNDSSIVDKVIDIYRNANGVPQIEIHAGSSKEDIIETYSGITINGGFAHPLFSSNQAGMPVKLSTQYVPIVIDKDITQMTCRDMEDRLKAFAEFVYPLNMPVVVFCRSMDNDIANMIGSLNNRNYNRAVNEKRNFSNMVLCVSINAQGSVGTGFMSDVAMLTGAKMITDFDVSQFNADVISETELVIRDNAVQLDKITDDLKAKIDAQVEVIESAIRDLGAGSHDSTVARILRLRKNSLTGGRVKIFVGGDVLSDVMERQDRFTDVKEAIKSALEGGIIPGCGSVLLEVGRELRNKYPTDEIAIRLSDVFSYQYCHLMDVNRAGIYSTDPKDIVFTNLATGEVANNPKDLGVYDTAGALSNALRAGHKTASLLINLSGVLLGNNLGRKTIKIG